MFIVIPVNKVRNPFSSFFYRRKVILWISSLYFIVLNCASENGLSLLTLGLEYEDITPRTSNLAFKVYDFIGAPLSDWRTNGFLLFFILTFFR